MMPVLQKLLSKLFEFKFQYLFFIRLISLTKMCECTLIPEILSNSPAYYTTWATQGYMPGDGAVNLTVDWIFNHQGKYQDAALNSSYVFGKKNLLGSGWARDFFPKSRSDLFFMLDEGYALNQKTIEINKERFPDFNQTDPAERLKSFQNAIKSRGWRGLGLWNRVTSPADAAKFANWSKFAGVMYWKIDGPDDDCSCQQAAKKVFPQLIVEHGKCPVNGCPLNNPDGSGVYDDGAAKAMMGVLGCSDVVRSYDTVPTLSIPTTLSRLSAILKMANSSLPPGNNTAMLNGDAEGYVTNSLGCIIGPMRSPRHGLRPLVHETGMSTAREIDLFFMGNRQAKRRITEIDRIVHWTRLAPAFGARAVGGTAMEIDPLTLYDTWSFEKGDTWDHRVWDTTLRQGAPARVSRGGLPLPIILDQKYPAIMEEKNNESQCFFGNHPPSVELFNNNRSAILKTTGNAVVIASGSCQWGNFFSSSNIDGYYTFSFTVDALFGEIFVGIGPPTLALNSWANSPGVFSYGSKGLKASEKGYEKYGQNWVTGDVINVTLNLSAGTISFAHNGIDLGIAFNDLSSLVSTGVMKMINKNRKYPSTPSSFSTSVSSPTMSSRFAAIAFLYESKAGITFGGILPPVVPYLVTTKYPNGAVAITTLGRTSPRPVGYHTPRVHVFQSMLIGSVTSSSEYYTLKTNATLPPIGIFGVFSNLSLGFLPGTVSSMSRVLAQDLAGEDVTDVTSHILLNKSSDVITIGGDLIHSIGTAAQPAGDISEPGLVIVVELKQ